MGVGLTSEPLAQLSRRYTHLIWILLLVLLASGGLLIVAEPGRTITNPVFYLKMSLLAVVILATLWLAAAARRYGDAPPGLHRLLAGVTLLLWIGIIFCGRFIAYFEST